jgi:hypothetical protein
MKQYKLLPTGPQRETPEITHRPKMEQCSLYPANFGIYDPAMVTERLGGYILHTAKLKYARQIEWVNLERARQGLDPWSFTHLTAGIKSVDKLIPPFHVQIETPFLYNPDILDSWWLLNDIDTDPTSEIDCYESGRSWRRRLWFTYHHGEPKYANRVMDTTEVLIPPNGVNCIDTFVYPDRCEWVLNGRTMKVVHANFNYRYTLIGTLIVLSDAASDVTVDCRKVAVKQL